MQDELRYAVAKHQAGQLGQAALLYQRILGQKPEHAEALHLLGVLHHQQGEHARAAEEIMRAVAIRPSVPLYHANLAEVYRSLGQLDRAAGAARTALQLAPEYPEALNNMGLALQGLGKHAEAAEHFRKALEKQPDFGAVHNNLGITLRELRDVPGALEHFRRAIELDASFAGAHTNLGLLLLDMGKPEEALPHCREGVRLYPQLAPMHHNLATALRGVKDFVGARAAYLEAVRLDANLMVAHAHLGMLLAQEGKAGEAIPWLKQAAELETNNTNNWSALADAYMEVDDYAAAIPAWERVLEIDANRADAHRNLGWALQEEGRLDAAMLHYHISEQLEPNAPGTYLNRGGLHEERGEMAEAEVAFRAALKVQPNFGLAHARLATLLRGKLSDEDFAALETRLGENLAKGPRARLLFARAHVLDARGEFAKAAESLREANALTVEIGGEARAYTPADHERFIDRTIEIFNADFFARNVGGGSPTRRPVFVLGLPRSGTTLIEQVLASHRDVHGAGELRFARQSFEAIPGELKRGGPPVACAHELDPATLRRLAEKHEERLSELNKTSSRIVDKMPDNYMYLGLLAALFPNATFIYCRRDLRDIAVSCWMTDFRSIRWANNTEHIAHRFLQHRRIMAHWRSVLPVQLHDVDYEETVEDLEGVARHLVAACGLEWDPACLEFHRTDRPIRTASVTQVRQPIYKRSVARWKNYEPHLGELFVKIST
jgi:tetratricopeptide (TPR) repeat protein